MIAAQWPFAGECQCTELPISELREFLHRPKQIADLGQDGVFKNWLVGHKRVGGSDALNGCIQMMEELVGDTRGNLCAVSPTE